jgi:hypothetical protein
MRSSLITVSLSFALATALIPSLAEAQTPATSRRASVALEADAVAYGIGGYSGIVSVSLPNGLQFAVGNGRYEVPTFMLEADANFEAARWKATSTSIQVVRAMYRFRGPNKNGLALGAIVLNQNWRLRSKALGGESKFSPLSVGLTAGYYLHIGKHFYLYPTTAFTYNKVVSGKASVNGTPYSVAKFGPNGSLHAGWEFTR